jgi:hypothetical protein
VYICYYSFTKKGKKLESKLGNEKSTKINVEKRKVKWSFKKPIFKKLWSQSVKLSNTLLA